MLIKGETKVQDDSLLVIEGSYCGIFTIENADGDILENDSDDDGGNPVQSQTQ